MVFILVRRVCCWTIKTKKKRRAKRRWVRETHRASHRLYIVAGKKKTKLVFIFKLILRYNIFIVYYTHKRSAGIPTSIFAITITERLSSVCPWWCGEVLDRLLHYLLYCIEYLRLFSSNTSCGSYICECAHIIISLYSMVVWWPFV